MGMSDYNTHMMVFPKLFQSTYLSWMSFLHDNVPVHKADFMKT